MLSTLKPGDPVGTCPDGEWRVDQVFGGWRDRSPVLTYPHMRASTSGRSQTPEQLIDFNFNDNRLKRRKGNNKQVFLHLNHTFIHHREKIASPQKMLFIPFQHL